jgi:Uncharacterized conserved protein
MLVVNAFYVIKEEQEAAFLAEMKVLVEKSRTEEGNVSYALYKQTDMPLRYAMIETWKNRTAFDEHTQMPHFTDYASRSDQYFAAPKQVALYETAEKCE